MRNISRRTALAGIAAISATGGAGVALAASAAPEGLPAVPATPRDRIKAAGREIANALDEYDAELGEGWQTTVLVRSASTDAKPISIVTAEPHGVPKPDPLVDAIDAYWAALADFDCNAPHDQDDDAVNAYADATFYPRLTALDEWDQPAATCKGAIAALRFILKESEGFEMGTGTTAMVRAALGYLEGRRVS